MRRHPLRLFLDSNVLIGGIISPWGLDKAVLSLCAARIGKLVLAEAVRDEIEEVILLRTGTLSPSDSKQVIENYRKVIQLIDPELVPYPDVERVRSNRHLIRHLADVPVILSAMDSKPDWLLTHNTKHFTQDVARRARLRIATPAAFFRAFSESLK
jgi:predicted nucleic acid-binding protein